MKKLTRAAVSVGTALTSAAMFSLTAFADGAAETTKVAQPSTAQTLLSILPLPLVLILMYFLIFRPQSKRDKEAQAMRDNIQIGDEICTAGGMVGIVIRVADDTVVIETAGERTKIRIKKWAIHENITQTELAQEAEKARKAARQKGIAAAGINADDKSKNKD